MKIKTKKDAEDYLRLVEGYSRVVEKSLVKARSQQIIAPSATTLAKSAAKRISNLRQDYKILFSHKKAAYKKYFEISNRINLELDVFEDNHAKKLYEDLGFKETGEVEFIRGRKYLKMIYENRN